ncbi:MAG TPA: DUF559 domain-containing protein [Polyangiales bacterium]
MSVVVGRSRDVLRALVDAGMQVVTTRAVVAREMAVDFLTQAASSALHERALAALAETSLEWEHKSPGERALWLEQVQSKPLSLDAAFAVQWLQGREERSEGDPIAQVALLTQWQTSGLPLLVTSGAANVLAQAVALAEAAPRLAVVFLVELHALAPTLNAQTSRVRVLLHDAIIRPSVDDSLRREISLGVEPVELQVGAPTPPQATRGMRYVDDADADEGAPASKAVREALREPALRELREEASRAQSTVGAEGAADRAAETADRARSMVERFLYELLQRSPYTCDVFELNARLPFRFGRQFLEADFAARSLCLVLEVDGYFHFSDFDAYRRDRRKDLLLQQRGYLVARFLAADVLERTSTVLGQIEQLVTSRRRQGNAQED